MCYLSPDGRADGAELRLRRDRHGAGRGAGRAASRAARRHGIGNFWADLDPRARSTCCCRSRSCCALCSWSGRACRRTSAPTSTATTLEGAEQTIAQGPVASAGRDQDAGHQRRRLLQRQLGAPVREPDAALQFRRRCVLIFADRCGARPTCSAAWSATSGRAGRSSPPWACCSWPASPSSMRPRAAGNPAARRARRRSSGRQHGGQGGALRHRRCRRCSRSITTAASCGAVNAMHDSFMPLGGMCR